MRDISYLEIRLNYLEAHADHLERKVNQIIQLLEKDAPVEVTAKDDKGADRERIA